MNLFNAANLDIAMVIVGLLTFVVLFSVLSVVFRRRLDVDRRIRSRRPEPEAAGWAAVRGKVEALFRPLGELIPRSPAEMSKHEKRLAQAGIRRKDAVVLFHGVQAALILVLILIALATGHLREHTLIAGALCIFFGVVLPEVWLTRVIEARKDRIQAAIPDALDLAVVCVEAGLGLDQSLVRIADELQEAYPDLADEFKLRNIEVSMGRDRAEAFRNLADRTGVEDLKSLVAILIQTDRFGASVGQALRVFAESLRIKRSQRARERATKLPVKMIPVIALFIFPAIFIVVAGPAVIQIVRQLLPMMAGR